jgi:putative membrane protein
VTENFNPNRARDHLANERTFLAWVRTGAAIVVFGFAIGRFAIAIRQLSALQGHPAGFVLDLITILTVLFGLALAGYLIYAEKSLG